MSQSLSLYIVTARQINDIIEAPDAPGHRHGHGHNRANYPCSGLDFMATFQIARIGFASLQLCLANKLFAYLTQIVAPTGERGSCRKCGRGIISTAAFNENVAKVSATKCCLANERCSFVLLPWLPWLPMLPLPLPLPLPLLPAAAGNLNLQLYNFR